MLNKLIQDALETERDFEAHLAPKICVVGCGGGGSNSVHRINRVALEGVDTIAINTDKFHLARIDVKKRLLIGEHATSGYGTGGDPTLGEKVAHDAMDKIEALVREYDIVFVTAGMGGGTGTGVAPVVAEAARRHGAISVALVTIPFDIEKGRLRVAFNGIAKLRESAHSTIILDNNRLLKIAPKLPIEQAFMVMDQLIVEVVKGVTETVCETSMINLDFADFRSLMLKGGASTVLYGESEDAQKVVAEAISNPLLDIDFEGATGAMIHLTGGPSLSLRKAYEVFNGITNKLGDCAHIKLGARIDPDIGQSIKLMAIVTGVRTPEDPDAFRLPEIDGLISTRIAMANVLG
ncbi:MAG: cell division protein FtsZ [Thermoplasmata archaeon]|nr:cell division protein FtsZ [Thermoplasmata archaeon]MCJ7561595.1 cell division protein FtsZ [Thermoplasmata archaeon]TFG67678.1 MAG: cell division protein FtsZ [Methanomassiliicoccus sp.]